MAKTACARPAAGAVPRRLAALLALAAACGLPACEGGTAGADAGVSPADVPLEATVRTIHDALAAGTLTCEGLVDHYLARIEAYDDRGPGLNAILAVHPRALETAREMDRLYAADGGEGRPLHCIPVIVKDNFDTADMPTTGASVGLARSVPPDDAFMVRRLREAGALVLAKSNLTELARGGTTISSLGGQTRNPYDLARTPGGSSGGTGAAIAANFGVLGTGSDTGQSIRSPASAQSLVGIRATRGLVSRDGVIPVSSTQDEVGPIVRTVEDAARMLDVVAGYDPSDPVTAFGVGRRPESYTDALDPDALAGARIGLVLDLMGGEAVHGPVNAVVEAAVASMESEGAEVVRVRIPRLAELTEAIALSEFEFRIAFNRYLESLGPGAPVGSLAEFVEGGEFHPSFRPGLEADLGVEAGLSDPEYLRRLARRHELRESVMTVIADHELDALLYPHQRRLVVPIGEDQVERNGVLSNSTGFPAVTFPGGFSEPDASAPLGVPVGIELLGPEWTEPTLIGLAYAFEQATSVRRPPVSTPPLP